MDTMARSGNNDDQKWVQLPDGSWEMPPLQRKYLEEMCATLMPRYDTEGEWARENNVVTRTTRRWRADPRFREEWERLSAETYATQEFIEPIIRNMHRQATTGTGSQAVKAAEILLKYTERMRPDRLELALAPSDEISKMSDDEVRRLALGEPEVLELESVEA